MHDDPDAHIRELSVTTRCNVHIEILAGFYLGGARPAPLLKINPFLKKLSFRPPLERFLNESLFSTACVIVN